MTDSIEYDKKLKAFASLMFKDIRKYVNENREECEKWIQAKCEGEESER